MGTSVLKRYFRMGKGHGYAPLPIKAQEVHNSTTVFDLTFTGYIKIHMVKGTKHDCKFNKQVKLNELII